MATGVSCATLDAGVPVAIARAFITGLFAPPVRGSLGTSVVLGAGRALGSAVVALLADRGESVRAVDDGTTGFVTIIDFRVVFDEADVAAAGALQRLLHGGDTVFVDLEPVTPVAPCGVPLACILAAPQYGVAASLQRIVFLRDGVGAASLEHERNAAWWASPHGLPALGAGAAKLANYVYFRESRFQSVEFEDSVVVSRRARALHSDAFFVDPHKEREVFFDDAPGGGPRSVRALDGEPLVHHFSWARSKEGMLRKVRAWSHNADADRNWAALVEAEFAHDFTGFDFVHNHSFRTLAVPWIDELRARRRAEAAVLQRQL